MLKGTPPFSVTMTTSSTLTDQLLGSMMLGSTVKHTPVLSSVSP